MIRNMKTLEDLVAFLHERSDVYRIPSNYFDIEVFARAVLQIPECKFQNVNFKIGSKYWFFRAKEKFWSANDEVEIYGEQFDIFGYVIYRMERGGVRQLSYFSHSGEFRDAFIHSILKPEHQMTSQQVADLYRSME